MKSLFIKLSDVEDIKQFVNTLARFECDFELLQGRYMIDAKSIMGIFSLNLNEKLQLDIHAEGKELDNILELLNKYII